MDDDRPLRQKKTPLKNLEIMSVEVLKDYIFELKAEIERAENTIRMKQTAHETADQVFR